MSSLRGGRAKLDAREDAYARSLAEAGDHVCIPWTGHDAAGRYVCPGFEYKPNRGLVAYIIPLQLFQAGLVPTTLQTVGSVGVRITSVSADELKSERFRLLQTYLRMVKIAGMETEVKFNPRPEDYHVVVHGPYHKTIVGHLVARPDGSGKRFFVADGVPPEAAQEAIETSRINATTPDTLVPATGVARVEAAIQSQRSSNTIAPRPGTPKPGKKASKEEECEE